MLSLSRIIESLLEKASVLSSKKDLQAGQYAAASTDGEKLAFHNILYQIYVSDDEKEINTCLQHTENPETNELYDLKNNCYYVYSSSNKKWVKSGTLNSKLPPNIFLFSKINEYLYFLFSDGSYVRTV